MSGLGAVGGVSAGKARTARRDRMRNGTATMEDVLTYRRRYPRSRLLSNYTGFKYTPPIGGGDAA